MPTAKKPVAKKKTAAQPKRTVAKVSPVKGKTLEWYVASQKGWQRDALAKIQTAVNAAATGATASIKWGQPVWESNGPFAWMKAFGKHVSLGFWRGAEMDDHARRLEGDGDRMRHLKFREGDPIDAKLVVAYVREAIGLNKAKGNPAMSKKR